jgi:hypothetical protein
LTCPLGRVKQESRPSLLGKGGMKGCAEMLKRIVWIGIGAMAIFFWHGMGYADDLNDGISEYTEENISADEAMGANKDNNINYIVVDAIGKAKSTKKDKPEAAAKSKEITNIPDAATDNNENSVVVEAGSRVDKVYNIIIEK